MIIKLAFEFTKLGLKLVCMAKITKSYLNWLIQALRRATWFGCVAWLVGAGRRTRLVGLPSQSAGQNLNRQHLIGPGLPRLGLVGLIFWP